MRNARHNTPTASDHGSWGPWSGATRHVRPHLGSATAVPLFGDRHYTWCPACRDHTLVAGTVTLLTPTGTLPVGQWAVCESCHHTPGGYARA